MKSGELQLANGSGRDEVQWTSTRNNLPGILHQKKIHRAGKKGVENL
jgi:hypothetical protein